MSLVLYSTLSIHESLNILGRVTIFWWPKTRTLSPANTWAGQLKWYSKFTQRYLINFNTFKSRLCLLCMDRKLGNTL